MSVVYSRIIAAVAVLGLLSTAVFGSLYVSDQDEARWAGIAPPAQDALTQSLDLDRIASFQYLDDAHVRVTDERGHKFAMTFTTPCPEFRSAKDFSLITEGFRNMDRFTAVGVAGHICTFRDFAVEH
jgi:hypothetical protein